MAARLLQRGVREPQEGPQLYETPPEAVEALLRHEPLPPRLWEPCAGRGAIARVLQKHGHHVTAHDLVAWDGADAAVRAGHDFLATREAPKRCGAIVTNPPFDHADAFIRHGLKLVPKVVVLLRLAALEGAGRADIIDRHLARLWVGIERLPMMHREGWTGKRLSGNAAPFGWFVFEWRVRGDGFVGRRISWRQ